MAWNITARKKEGRNFFEIVVKFSLIFEIFVNFKILKRQRCNRFDHPLTAGAKM